MSFKERIIDVWNKIENVVLVNHACIACRKEIPDGLEFSMCENCEKSLEIISGNLCEICGEEILEGNRLCDSCKNTKYEFDISRSYAKYLDIEANIVKRFKYSSKKYYAKYIAKLMATNKAYFDAVDYLTFVPIGRKRHRERGFNQAEEIALMLGEIMNIPVLDLLEKTGNEKHQAGLTQKERRENLSGTIRIKDETKALIKNTTIMIIDDVFTTGSTLSECAKVIKSVRAYKPKRVLCYTFAKTDYNSSNNGQNLQNN